MGGREGAIRLSEEVQAEGEEFLRVACAHGLEGIIAKHRDRPWWQKITCSRRDSFVIVGYEPSTLPGAVGRLLLAAQKRGSLVYVGGCGTGWSRSESVRLRELLDKIVTNEPAAALKRKGAVFTKPLLVAEVEYRAWTEDEKVRHPSFKGIRERSDNASVFNL